MNQIPVPDENDSLSEVDLDNETFFLHFSWNETASFWTLSIENANKESLASGIKIVPDTPLITQIRQSYLPAGELIAVTLDRSNTISRDDLPNGRVAMVYLTESEVAAL